jgi:hypothetical protein
MRSVSYTLSGLSGKIAAIYASVSGAAPFGGQNARLTRRRSTVYS